MRCPRLAIIASHPVQYYSPWFQYLAKTGRVELKVFYLWNSAMRGHYDPGFGHAVEWDVPLLDGYAHEFVPNVSKRSGPQHFAGLNNPSLPARLRAFAPDTALLIGYKYLSLVRLLFSRWPARPRIPLIFRGDSHRLVPRPGGLKEKLRHILISAAFSRFAAVLYVGKANFDYFRSHGVGAARLFLAPHAVDNDRFMANPEEVQRQAALWRQSLGVPSDHALIAFVGKFEDKKRPLDLLAAFRQVHTPHASLLFVGAGHLEDAVRAAAADVPNVYFAPFQNQSQMPRTYAAAELIVLPSCGEGETWGLAINEALCLGRPVIVSDHVGCAQDLVIPGGNGLIFPAGNGLALAAALQEALSDRDRLARWGEQGRQIIRDHDYASSSEGLFAALRYIGF
jgi:glycosyltransferase involved in cell wall biosynthesis